MPDSPFSIVAIAPFPSPTPYFPMESLNMPWSLVYRSSAAPAEVTGALLLKSGVRPALAAVPPNGGGTQLAPEEAESYGDGSCPETRACTRFTCSDSVEMESRRVSSSARVRDFGCLARTDA